MVAIPVVVPADTEAPTVAVPALETVAPAETPVWPEAYAEVETRDTSSLHR